MQAILEAIFRATSCILDTPLPEQPPERLINLGILLAGMEWWRVRHRSWLALIKRHDLEAVDAVFKGAIAAMGVKPQQLAMEALWALENINCIPSHDLNAITASLQTHESPGNNAQELRNILEVRNTLFQIYIEITKTYCGFHDLIPKVPAEPNWELAKSVILSPQALMRALKHPSEGICLNAAKLLRYTGNDEAANLGQEFLEEYYVWRQ